MTTNCPVAVPFQARKARWLLVIGALAATAAGAAAPSLADQPPPLPAAVAKAVKETILPHLEKTGVTSVGVLKFLVKASPQGRASPRTGAINSDLAAQFQLAILMNVRRTKEIAVLLDPNGVAAKIPSATHLQADALANLFRADYAVVVGPPTMRVKPDALIFGVATVADDLQTATVDARMYRRGGANAENLCVFSASLRAADLPAAGQSFLASRGLFTGGRPQGVDDAGAIKPASLAADVRTGRRPFPLEDPAAPVTLAITYDGARQPIEFRDGGGFVPEPRQGQKVSLTIAKARQDGQRYAVVLKVNGENTAERGTLPDIKSMKWVLSDAFMKLPVRGYAVGTKSLQPFTVFSEAESAKRAFDYGIDAGTITMTVFAEQADSGSAQPDPADQRQLAGDSSGSSDLDQLLLEGGVRLDPRQSFESLDAAKGALESMLAAAPRGIIGEGDEVESFKQEIVKFKANPDPVMSVVIRYYTPRP